MITLCLDMWNVRLSSSLFENGVLPSALFVSHHQSVIYSYFNVILLSFYQCAAIRPSENPFSYPTNSPLSIPVRRPSVIQIVTDFPVKQPLETVFCLSESWGKNHLLLGGIRSWETERVYHLDKKKDAPIDLLIK